MKKHINRSLIILVIVFLSACKQEDNRTANKTSEIASTDNLKTMFNSEVVVSDLDIPWGFTFLPDNSMLITEKLGDLIHVKDGIKTKISGLPEVKVLGQGGLLDIELHPKYEQNGFIYITYASSDGEGKGANTTLIRCKLEGTNLVDVKRLYKATPNSKKGQHFGARIEFDNDGYLYFSVGDRGNRDENPQDITRDCGKVYRLNDDGSIPESNPFVNTPNAKQAIFSYGHRNIQGMAKHPETGDIWTHEHGPRGGDEINISKSGINYGWPLASYGVNYSGTKFTDNTSLPNMKDPMHHWTPSIAPSGMIFVTSDIYPSLKGHLLVGSLKFQYVNICYLKNNSVAKEERILEGIGRVRSMRQGPDGYIYVGVENVGIVKLLPSK